MTIIVCLATSKFVAIVADRRLSMIAPDGRATPVEDNRSKAVVRCASEVWGYTGLAEIDNAPTNVWLAQSLALGGTSSMNLITAGNNAFQKPWTRRIRRNSLPTAFLGAGWSNKKAQPTIATVSNYHRADGTPGDQVSRKFSTHRQRLRRNQPAIWRSAGASLVTSAQTDLRRTLQRASYDLDPRDAVNAIINAVRITGDSEQSVGGNLLSVVLHRPRRDATSVVFAPHLAEATSSQLWVSGAVSPIQFGPDVACRGSIATNARGGPLGSEGSIVQTPAGVHVEYPVWLFVSNRVGGTKLPVATSPAGRSEVFAASSPEYLPKLPSRFNVALARIGDGERFRTFVRGLAGVDDIVFCTKERQLTPISIRDCLGAG